MTRKRHDELGPGARRRRLAAAMVRPAVAAALLMVVYYLAPLDRPLEARTWIAFVLGLVALALILVWEVRAIAAADLPRLRAIQTVAIGLPMLLLLFAAIYVVIASEPGSFTEVLGRTDALYYTVTVFATVGFGDIAPLSEVARIVTMIQMLLGLVVVGLIAKIVLGAVDTAVRRRASEQQEAEQTGDHGDGG